MDTPTRSITYNVEGERLPPHPERDLLCFDYLCSSGGLAA